MLSLEKLKRRTFMTKTVNFWIIRVTVACFGSDVYVPRKICSSWFLWHDLRTCKNISFYHLRYVWNKFGLLEKKRRLSVFFEKLFRRIALLYTKRYVRLQQNPQKKKAFTYENTRLISDLYQSGWYPGNCKLLQFNQPLTPIEDVVVV